VGRRRLTVCVRDGELGVINPRRSVNMGLAWTGAVLPSPKFHWYCVMSLDCTALKFTVSAVSPLVGLVENAAVRDTPGSGTGSTGSGSGSTGSGSGSTGAGTGSTGSGSGSTGAGTGSTGAGTGSTGAGTGSTGSGIGSGTGSGIMTVAGVVPIKGRPADPLSLLEPPHALRNIVNKSATVILM
jgi:hypothetical protein